MKFIPLHALVVTAGPMATAVFPTHEVLGLKDVARDLVGDRARAPGFLPPAVEELARRVGAKLTLGERAVVSADDLDRHQRLALVKGAATHGASIIYVLDDPAIDPEMARGEGVAEVAFLSRGPVTPVPPIATGGDLLARLGDRFVGITAVGDIHGMQHSLLDALAWARARRHFVVFLGDYVDYGTATLEVAEEVHRLVTRGEAVCVLGNHERKIHRWLMASRQGTRRPRLSDGNRVTVDALERLRPDARNRWAGRFCAAVWHAMPVIDVGSVVFTHAAVHPSYWTSTPKPEWVERYALFGEGEAIPGGRFTMSYRWIDEVPADRVVIVGHDVRATEPRIVTGVRGGRVVYLDTGCGKGGSLSTADLRLQPDGMLRLENLNLH